MPLSMVVGLSLGEFVLDGDLALLPKRGRSPSSFKGSGWEFLNWTGSAPVIANFVALEQQIILVKTRSESV